MYRLKRKYLTYDNGRKNGFNNTSITVLLIFPVLYIFIFLYYHLSFVRSFKKQDSKMVNMK